MGGDLTACSGGVGDATGDGLDDLVASTPENGSAYFFRSETAGTKTAFDLPSWKFSPGFGSSFAALFGTCAPSSKLRPDFNPILSVSKNTSKPSLTTIPTTAA